MTTDPECPAHWALAQERVEHRILDNSDTGYRYGRNFAALWNKGEPFIHVEHDIVPWPGAIKELIECPEPWCTFESVDVGGVIHLGFGIGKYRPTDERAPKKWSETDWRCLDGQVISELRRMYAGETEDAAQICFHSPPVAHARTVPS